MKGGVEVNIAPNLFLFVIRLYSTVCLWFMSTGAHMGQMSEHCWAGVKQMSVYGALETLPYLCRMACRWRG